MIELVAGISILVNVWLGYELGSEKELSDNIGQIVIDQSKQLHKCFKELDKDEVRQARTEEAIRKLATENANQIAELERLSAVSADFFNCEIPVDLVDALQASSRD